MLTGMPDRQRRETYEAAIMLAEPYQIEDCLEPTRVGYGFCALYPPLTAPADRSC